MTRDGATFLLALLVGFLFHGFLLYKLLTDREFSVRFADRTRYPLTYFGDEDSGGEAFLYLMVPVLFLLFSCGLCFFLFKLLSSMG